MPEILKVLITRELLPLIAWEPENAAPEGFALLVAEDGRQAWQCVAEKQPDLVIMDLNTAGMPGDELCRRIHKDPRLRHIPVVLTVQSGHPDELNRCLKARCADILFKPLSKHLLTASARRILGLQYRSFPRIPMHLSVEHSCEENTSRTAVCVNLSSGGMFVESNSPLPQGEWVRVSFTLPGTTRLITSQASVAWTNRPDNPVNKNLPPGMGLQFVSLGLSDLLAICRYIRHRSEAPAATEPGR